VSRGIESVLETRLPSINLKQLSGILGLSPTTVSRALNGYPEVNEATRKRVEDAARQHHYIPNTRAKSLATGRSMAIGHVIPVSKRNEMVNPIFADFIAGAGEIYLENGYDMMLSIVPDDDEERAYRQIASRRSVDGIILQSPVQGDRRISLLRNIGLPFVVHGRSSHETADYAWIDVDNTRAFRRATAHLAQLGHERIALINGLETMDFAMRRRAGYLDALASAGIVQDPELMTSGEMTETYGHRTATAMLSLPRPPTGIVVASLITAIGVRRAVQERGLEIGRDISVVTHDDELSYFRNDGANPVFTAVRSSVRQAGRQAALMLLDQIRDPGAADVRTLLEAELVQGQSSGPPV